MVSSQAFPKSVGNLKSMAADATSKNGSRSSPSGEQDSSPGSDASDITAADRALSSGVRSGPQVCQPWESAGRWIAYFRANLADAPDVVWSPVPMLDAQERLAVLSSIQTFQLGESGEGRHIKACARRWVERGGDEDYLLALDLFLKEEHRHARLLSRFLHQERSGLKTRQWSDGCFRWLRHLLGLRTSISVLITAEIIAQVYYLALMQSTKSTTLRGICRRVLRDERAHVAFQQGQLDKLSQGWSAIRTAVVRTGESLLFRLACRVVWHDHRTVFRAAGMSRRDFHDRAMRRFRVAKRQSRRSGRGPELPG
ncbi:MAG: hypothetical protein AAF989_00785 [Planctomycetota bacterium]